MPPAASEQLLFSLAMSNEALSAVEVHYQLSLDHFTDLYGHIDNISRGEHIYKSLCRFSVSTSANPDPYTLWLPSNELETNLLKLLSNHLDDPDQNPLSPEWKGFINLACRYVQSF